MGARRGGKTRRVRMTNRRAEALSAIRHLRGARALYQRDGEPVTETTLRSWMERAERAGGLPVTGHIHRLRHTFCSHRAMHGAPAKAIQELAGHADLSTTMRYMHLSPASLNQAIRLLEQPVATDSRSPAHARGETAETAPASKENRRPHVNAGVYGVAPLETLTSESIASMYAVNVAGLLDATKAAVPLFPPEGGSIINIGSIVSELAPPMISAYSGSKAAINT